MPSDLKRAASPTCSPFGFACCGWLFLLLACLAVASLRAAETLPAAPTRYFNDYAGVVSAATLDRLNTELETLEKESSNQILVAIYPKMQTESSIEDYCHRIFATWHVGDKGKDNGAVLFIFVQDHKMRIETNRGLEGALPDATCEDIIADQIAPHFKAKDYDGGVIAGVESMIQATKGEYKGNGQTVNQEQQGATGTGSTGSAIGGGAMLVLFIIFFLVYLSMRGTLIGGVGSMILGGLLSGGGRGFGGGGGGGDGGFFSGGGGGGGGFSSGGGGSGGGGGASGGW